MPELLGRTQKLFRAEGSKDPFLLIESLSGMLIIGILSSGLRFKKAIKILYSINTFRSLSDAPIYYNFLIRK